MNYNGGLLGAGSGNTLALIGVPGDDAAVLTATQVILNGSTPIAYGNVAFFTFDLGAGENSLLIDHATLNLNRDDAISAGTKVTVAGGALNFNGHADEIGDLTLTAGGHVHATAIHNTTTTVASGTLTATSIVCDTLIIGSPSGAANAVTAKAALTPDVAAPRSIASDLSSSTAARDAANDMTSVNCTSARGTTEFQQNHRINYSGLLHGIHPTRTSSPAGSALCHNGRYTNKFVIGNRVICSVVGASKAA